jgi:hypothetical protein
MKQRREGDSTYAILNPMAVIKHPSKADSRQEYTKRSPRHHPPILWVGQKETQVGSLRTVTTGERVLGL